MSRAGLALLAGSFALQLSSFSRAVSLIVAITIALAACRRWRLLGAFLGGVLLFAAAASTVIDQRLSHKFEGDSILTTARLLDYPRVSGKSVGLLLGAVDDERLPGRIRVSWFEPPVMPRLGDVWQLELRLQRPRGSSNPGGFDTETWMVRERITAAGYVVPGRRNLLLASDQLSGLQRYRTRLIERIVRVVDEPQVAAVIVAVAVGTRHLLQREQWDRYAVTGTSHLMAISGLHVGLAALAAFMACSVLLAVSGVRGNNYKLALLLSLLIAALYVLLSGLAVPAQRAMLMLLIGTVVVLRERQLQSHSLVLGAAVLITVANPLSTMTPGFKLSFAAVILLLWMGQQSQPAGRVAGMRQLASMQLLLLLGLLPMTVLIFDRVALLAPFVNFVAVPLFSVVTVPATLVAAAGGSDVFLQIAATSIGWLEKLIAWVAGSTWADTKVAELAPWVQPLLLLPLIWALPPGWPGRAAAWLALVALLMWRPAAPPFSCVDLTFMDVGQGLGVAVRSNRHSLLFDTGPLYRSGASAAEHAILPFLRSQRIASLDKLLVSHADMDHAGGVSAVLQSFPVTDLMWGEALPDASRRGRPCRQGERWSWDGIDFHILHPPQAGFSGNDVSCVLLITAGVHHALLTGDIELAAEQALVRTGNLPRVDIVTVPHHGSLTSSSTPFAERLLPDLAVVSAGHRNRWRFPRDEVVRRWREAGAEVLRTDLSGAIGVRMCQRSGVQILRQEREYRRRLWHEP